MTEGFAERRERKRQEKEAARERATARRDQMLAVFNDGTMPVADRLACLERCMTHYTAELRCLQIENLEDGQHFALDCLERTIRCFNGMAPMLKRSNAELELVPVAEADQAQVEAWLQELH
jgi:hypothetical protein